MLIVQTTKREGVDYLPQTLGQLGDVGGRRKIIVSDGPLVEGFKAPKEWIVIELPKSGARATGQYCLRYAATEPQIKDLILLQDDLEFCDDAGTVMDQVQVPDECIATTFYTGSVVPNLQPKYPGEPRLVVSAAYGTAQALKFSGKALTYLATRDLFSAPGISSLEPHLFDDSLFALARVSPFPFLAQVIPNPVKHIGHVSACGSMNQHRPPWTVPKGEKFPVDPKTLPVRIVRNGFGDS